MPDTPRPTGSGMEEYWAKRVRDLIEDETGSLAALIGEAHQLILNAPEGFREQAMAKLEVAYLRVVGRSAGG
jgi:hypothetical protein